MTAPTDNLIHGDRLWASIHEMAEIGQSVRGGNNPQTLADADGEGRLLFQLLPEGIKSAAVFTFPAM